MSLNGNHMSASQRKILELEHEIQTLQQSAVEFCAFVNYVVTYHPTHKATEESPALPNKFRVDSKLMAACEPFKIVRCEISKQDGAKGMDFVLCTPEPRKEPSRIIIP